MPKRLKDIQFSSDNPKINLKGPTFKKRVPIKKNKNIIYKETSPITEIKDLSTGENQKYIYIKGKNFSPPKYLGNLLRIGVVGFLIIILLNTINVYVLGKSLEKDISNTAYQGYSYLIDAGKSATQIQFDNALTAFDNALNNFNQAEEELWFINTDYTFFSEQSNISQAVNALLEGGKYFSFAGKYFLQAVEEFNKIPLYFVSKNNLNEKSPSITDTLKLGLEKTNLAIEQVSYAAKEISKIDSSTLPPELQSRFLFAKKKIEEISKILEETSLHFPAILKLLGDRYPHRYLILFQNNNEIRPTGGFIGSYAIMDINDGYIENLETYDVYDLDGAYWEIIEPPEEFYKFTSNWRFRDSNYSPDFSYSAKKRRPNSRYRNSY